MTIDEMVRHNEIYGKWQECVDFIKHFYEKFREDAEIEPGFTEVENMLDYAFFLIEKAEIDEAQDDEFA